MVTKLMLHIADVHNYKYQHDGSFTLRSHDVELTVFADPTISIHHDHRERGLLSYLSGC